MDDIDSFEEYQLQFTVDGSYTAVRCIDRDNYEALTDKEIAELIIKLAALLAL